MRFVMFTYVHPDDAAAYEAKPAGEQEAFIERHQDWFRKHREHIAGGEELAERVTAKTLRPGRQGDGVIMTDGPYIETKEAMGGFVVLTADSIDEAVAMASEWPSMSEMPGAVLQVQPVFERD
jgi:hypothetical protein